jgi:formate hydrogenlyase subunit 3/multisubunit Na+/H+ antiporter MnhD subunit
MNTVDLLKALFVVLTGVIFLASASIGLEAYNNDENLRKDKKSNYNFLAVSAAFSGFIMLVGAYLLYRAYTTQSSPSYY